jgi:hypothetical protein
LESLLVCVRRYDAHYDEVLQALWAKVLQPGIKAMKQAY